MERFGIGHCKDGYNAGWDNKGMESQEACNAVCLSEKQCKFAAWSRGKSCNRYTGAICDLKADTVYYRSFTTFVTKPSGIL